VTEKRRHPRMPVHYQINCRPADQSGTNSCSGLAVNASPGGLYFRISNCTCPPGRIVELDLSIPPGNGTLQRPGRISSFAKLLRVEHVESTKKPDASETHFGVAVQFCRHPKLTT